MLKQLSFIGVKKVKLAAYVDYIFSCFLLMEKTKPFTVKILNLINHASPVAIVPRYNNDKVDTKVGFDSQGVSIIKEKGNKKITDHKVVDVVTFSFFSFFNFKVNNPPMQ